MLRCAAPVTFNNSRSRTSISTRAKINEIQALCAQNIFDTAEYCQRGDIHHFSFANSFLADFRNGMSESASFHSAKKS